MGFVHFDPPPSTASAKLDGALRFNSLPSGRWWLRWIGDVAFHDRHVSKTQPTVSIALQNAEEGKHKERTSVRITVSQLWAARLGTLWVDKQITDSLIGEEREITFRPGDLQHRAAGATLSPTNPESDFMIPFWDHPFHKEHTKSHCIAGFIEGVFYIFPVTELIRFYFGSSGGLLRKLFSADFSPERLVHDASCVNTLAKVALPAEIPWTSAADVARILFSPAATNSAKLISRSMLAGTLSASSIQEVYANACFPFDTKTVQRVRGIKLTAPQDYVERFLVLEILSCAAPFPFSSLKYTCAAQSRRQTSAANSGASGTRGGEAVKTVASRGEPAAIGNQDSAKGLAPRTFLLGSGIRFPDLLNKPVFRVDGPAPAQVHVRMLPTSPLDGTGEGIASGHGRPIELAPEPDARHSLHRMKCPVESWTVYFDWLKRLSEMPWVESLAFVRIHPGQARQHWAHLPELIDDDGELIEATRRTESTPSMSMRLASIANVQVRGRLSGLLSLHPRDPDCKNSVYLWPQQRIVEPEALRAVLAACVAPGLLEAPRHIPLEESPGVARTDQAIEELRRWVDLK